MSGADLGIVLHAAGSDGQRHPLLPRPVAAACAALGRGRPRVEAVDLSGFRACLSADERRAYFGPQPLVEDTPRAHAELLRRCRSLVFVFASENGALACTLKAWIERVMVPGVGFAMADGQVSRERPLRIRSVSGVVLHHEPAGLGWLRSDASRLVLMRTLRTTLRAFGRSRWLALDGAGSGRPGGGRCLRGARGTDARAMTVLVILAHPLPDSFVRAVFDRVMAVLGEGGCAHSAIDLYREGYVPPRPLPAAHLEALATARSLVLIYPTWWSTQPAILSGWLAEARRADLGRIGRLVCFVTHGGSRWANVLGGEAGRLFLSRRFLKRCASGARMHWVGCYGLDRNRAADRARYLDRAGQESRRLLAARPDRAPPVPQPVLERPT